MAILDKFIKRKKKEIPERKEEKEVLEKKVEKTLEEAPKPSLEQRKAKRIRKRRKSSLAFKVLRSPYITEKSIRLGKLTQYTFKVLKGANKTEIKRAIEELYGVNVEGVRMSRKPTKKRRLGRREGKKTGFKKAVVKLKEGQTIDVFPH